MIRERNRTFSCYGKDKSLREWALCLRIVLLLSTLFIALSAPYLIELMGLIGNITGLAALDSSDQWSFRDDAKLHLAGIFPLVSEGGYHEREGASLQQRSHRNRHSTDGDRCLLFND